MNIGDGVIAAVRRHPALREIWLVGSRAEGRATDLSDWDFAIKTNEFRALGRALPGLLKSLEPLSQQWDRLSERCCWMLMLRGPIKVDLIFVDEPHVDEPPWSPTAENLDGIDIHFWDWMLWLRSKQAKGETELVSDELHKLFVHLLMPLGASGAPRSISDAVARYRAARGDAERRLGRSVSREIEAEVAPALTGW